MIKNILVLSFCILLLSSISFAEESLPQEVKSSESQGIDFWGDFKDSLSLLIEGSYTQFTAQNNLYYAAAGVPLVWYSFEEEERIQRRYGGTEIANIVDHIGDAGVALNFPLLHFGFYYYGKKTNNNHHVQFAKEYFAAMYLTLLESGVLSYIDVHQRPVTGDESFWETEFRGDSSWPSGHVVPYMTLYFKTLQFYGPYWSMIPLGLSVMASMQRVQDNKHWLSDVTASFVLSAFASEGVRKAAGYDKNHAFYKWIFEHEVAFGIERYQGAIGPRFSFTY